MSDKSPVILAFLSSGATTFFFQNVLTAVVMAFIGAAIGWCTKELLNAIKAHFKARKNAKK